MAKFLRFICFVIYVMGFSCAIAQDINVSGKGKFYIVRHAEKDTAGGRDPKLSAEGMVRAGDLYRYLKKKHIRKIYITKYLRSGMTADSLKIYQKIDTVIYTADTTGNGLAEKLAQGKKSRKPVLIVGHSNTVRAIVRKLGATFTLKEMPETQFDQIYIVKRKRKKVKLTIVQYGKMSSPAIM